MNGLLPLCPFPPLHWWAVARHGGLIDSNTSYQKQSLQNRLVIAGPQGRQLITFPVSHSKSGSDVRLSDHLPRMQAWRSLKTAYGGSPFFAFFEDELHALWTKHLPDRGEQNRELKAWSWASIQWVSEACHWPLPNSTDEAPRVGSAANDLRLKTALRGDGWTFHRYMQLFEQLNGFIPGCSILDALFVLGPQELSIRLDDLVTPPST